MSINKNIFPGILAVSCFLLSCSAQAATYEIVEGVPTYALTASKSGTGTGVINGIDAAVTSYVTGASVALTATPAPGSTFTGWSGDCSGTGACVLSMTADRSVDAAFAAVTLPAAHTFARDLKQGMTDGEVVFLQKFLNAAGFQVALSGAGSPGLESSYFGAATKSALTLYQQARAVIPANGYFGSITRNFVNAQTGAAAAPRYPFDKDLSFGMTDPDVIQLQKFLNGNGDVVARKGAGSPGLESSYFGVATRSQVAKFQNGRSIYPTDGSLNAATRAIINAI